MNRTYSNPWIPEEAKTILAKHEGSLLDVGGGASPYLGATHIVDALPFDAERLAANAWGPERCQASVGPPGQPRFFTATEPCCPAHSAGRTMRQSRFAAMRGTGVQVSEDQYTQLDLCDGREWPFDDNQFDFGLSSHCLEDLRDPLPAVRELARVCRKVLIITPSRLLEQTRGVDHPRYCGFPHHPWMVTARGNTLVFRRKTPMVMLPACHLVCPPGKTLKLEFGAFYWCGEKPIAEEDSVVWTRDYEDYCEFVQPFRNRRDLFVHDEYRHTLNYWVWKFRERVLGQP